MFKACNPLLQKWINSGEVAQVIVQFVSFRDKNEIHARQNTEDYRAISLLSSINKNFDKMIVKLTVKGCHKNDILTPTPFGIRSKMSCIDAIAKLKEFMHREVDHKKMARVCFVDLIKSFDMFSDEIFPTEMEIYVFRDEMTKKITIFLSEERQFISVNVFQAKQQLSTYGTPQGSV